MATKIGKLLSSNTLVGTGDDDTLVGGLFNDVFVGGAGADKMDGGLGGSDTVDYSASSEGVNVDLSTGFGWGGDAEGDTYRSIENAIGSAFDDVLIGNAGNNTMTGGKGSDIFVMTGGKDVFTDFSPPNAHALLFGGTLGISGRYSPPDGKDFNLSEIDLRAGASFNFHLEAKHDGVVVGTATILTSGAGTSIDFLDQSVAGAVSASFSGRFTSIDYFEYTSGFNGIASFFVAIPGDQIQVAAGTDIDALIASAVSDGKGGTLLSIPAQTYIGRDGKTYTSAPASSLDLVGIDPHSVSADWFV